MWITLLPEKNFNSESIFENLNILFFYEELSSL